MEPKRPHWLFFIPLLATALMALGASSSLADPIPGGSVPKFETELVKPPAMPHSQDLNKGHTLYRIAVRQFQQQILPPGPPNNYNATTVWSYGSIDDPGTVAEGGTFNYPAFTIEAEYNKKVTVEWMNDLVDEEGNFLQHLLPIDPTLHWANPPGGKNGRDTRPMFMTTPGPYTGPVPIVTHVHGAHTTEDSDGYPEAWYLPNANNIPNGYAKTGTFYDYYNKKYNMGKKGWVPGMAIFDYPNDQRATTLWYHDHTLGMTRANVYAGPAGFYLIRGGPDGDDEVLVEGTYNSATLPGPAPGVDDDPFGEYGEIPIVVQDRSFNADASLFYPDTRAFFDGYDGDFIPDTPVSPIWNPEFFGNMMVVNGATWPYLEVDPKRYRLRLLNGCNSRFLILKFEDPNVKVYQIGAEGGFLPDEPVLLNNHLYPGSTVYPESGPTAGATVLMGLAERADLIVDFSGAANSTFNLLNLGPDEPFGGGSICAPGENPDDDPCGFIPSDPSSTGLVMQFRVRPGPVADNTTDPEDLILPAITHLLDSEHTRHLSLNELAYENEEFEGPVAALLGTWDPYADEGEEATPLLWADQITENPALGATEEWKFYNVTEDAHPIHIHLVQFEVLGREVIGGGPSVAGSNGPLPWETGFKDTVISYPGEVTSVKLRFDYEGFYVWHCHIVEHEDNEMMRPYHVGPIPHNAPAQ